jgi:hypothetical protein
MTGGKQAASAVLALFIIGILAAYVLGTAITAIFNTNTTGWDTGTASLWLVIGIALAVGVVVLIFKATGLI